MSLNFQIIIFFVFCVNTTIAFTYLYRFFKEKKPKVNTIRYLYIIYSSSMIWSLGMGVMSVCANHNEAYFWRTFGILGTFVFMIGVQELLCTISGLSKRHQRLMDGVAYLGIPIFILYSLPGQTVFVDTEIGVSFYFKFNWITIVYGLYFFIVSTDILIVTLYMVKKHKLARVRAIGRRFMIVESMVFVGAIMDMVLPCLGIVAFPGSAITHFWGVIVLWYAIHEMYNSEITISNMSEYIYYSLDIPVVIFDADRKMRIINDSASSFFQISSSYASSNDVFIEELFNVNGNIYDFEGKSNSVNADCIKNDSKCQLSVSKIQDKYTDIIGYILIVTDLTSHYNTLTRLEQAKRDADAANMSKSLFLANMSHEIRTPMNAILGFTNLALKENISEVASEYFVDIKQAGETLLSIINDVLNISKIELGKHEIICSNYKASKLFNDVMLIIGVQAKEKNLIFDADISEQFPEELYGDVDKIREILINLLNNSVKYTKRGNIHFSAKVLKKENNIATIEMKVADSGIGIKEEDIGKIFDKFQRVDAGINSETEGTGLGLSITKGLVEIMGGTIAVESVYGVGTEFTVVIPQKIADETPISKDEIKKTDDFKKKFVLDNVKFLAVDDNRVNLKVISKVMEQYSIKYDLAGSGMEAIDLCKNNIYDVILMDQMMPVMDGIEAMKKIRMLPGYDMADPSKIVALTANVIEGVEDELLSEGFNGFIGKPINIKKFESVLCDVLPQNKYHFEEVVE